MPSKVMVMWRLCDWYLKSNVPMPQDQLIEIFKAITKPTKRPYLDEHGEPLSWDDKVNKETIATWQKVAAMVRYMYGTLLKRKTDSWDLHWIWINHRHEFPKLFDEDEVKQDLKKAKKLEAKQNVSE